MRKPATAAVNNETVNMAKHIDEEILKEIGEAVFKGYEMDEKSREGWMNSNAEYLKLATQYKEEKTFPWPDAANVKYPLIQTAATQFSARAYPALVPNKKPVKTAIIGKEEAELTDQSRKIGDHMSYQLMYEMDDWEEDMDKLCIILPVSGTVFKKTYYDPIKNMNVSKLCLPQDVVVNYWTKSIETAPRITHILELNANDVESRIRREVFVDTDYGEPYISSAPDKLNLNGISRPAEADDTTPFVFLEQHTRWDLDEDGYAEPYIITIEKNSKKVARVIPNYHPDLVEYKPDDDSTVVEIEPIHYFTKYGFIPSPDGGFYDMGFGLILGPLNESINTSLNQILDAGTLSTLQTGFISKGLKLRGGAYRMSPGEWKVVGANTEDLRKGIFPMPVSEPSNVLFQLLGMLIQAGKELSSVADIMVGKMPGQNTPAHTTMETVKQGMAVFTAIYKRIYRSLDKEFKKLFELNRLYLDSDVSYPVDLPREAYQEAMLTVSPTADPDAASDAENLMQAQTLMGLAEGGLINPQEATKRMLVAMRVPDIETLMQLPEPPPDPEQQKMEMEAQIKQMDSQTKQALAQAKAEQIQMQTQAAQQLEQMKLQMEQAKLQMAQEKHQQELKHKEELAALEIATKTRIAEIEAAIKQMQGSVDAVIKQEKAALESQIKAQKANQKEE